MKTLRMEVVDEGAKQDRRGRRIMIRERTEVLLREYEKSWLTQAEFARRSGVNYSTFAGWVRAGRAQSGRRASNSSVVHFAQVQLPARRPASTELSVALPDGVIVQGSDAAPVGALVCALRSEPY